MEIVNVGILRHPLNWLVVILMVMIAAAAFHFVTVHYKTVTE
jgi:hypothetical protein